MLVIIDVPGESFRFEAAPWSKEEARSIRATAENYISSHRHDANPDELTRANCAACVFAAGGWKGRRFSSPKVAGWERIFVQAGRTVPPVYLIRQIKAGGPYSDALRRDLATFTTLEPSEVWKALVAAQ